MKKPKQENWEKEFDSIFHYKGDGHWFHTVNTCVEDDTGVEVFGTTDTAWAVPDSFKSFIRSLLEKEHDKILHSKELKHIVDTAYAEGYEDGY